MVNINYLEETTFILIKTIIFGKSEFIHQFKSLNPVSFQFCVGLKKSGSLLIPALNIKLEQLKSKLKTNRPLTLIRSLRSNKS